MYSCEANNHLRTEHRAGCGWEVGWAHPLRTRRRVPCRAPTPAAQKAEASDQRESPAIMAGERREHTRCGGRGNTGHPRAPAPASEAASRTGEACSSPPSPRSCALRKTEREIAAAALVSCGSQGRDTRQLLRPADCPPRARSPARAPMSARGKIFSCPSSLSTSCAAEATLCSPGMGSPVLCPWQRRSTCVCAGFGKAD